MSKNKRKLKLYHLSYDMKINGMYSDRGQTVWQYAYSEKDAKSRIKIKGRCNIKIIKDE